MKAEVHWPQSKTELDFRNEERCLLFIKPELNPASCCWILLTDLFGILKEQFVLW